MKIIVKANAKKTMVKEYSPEKEAYVAEVAAPPEKNKANKEIVRYFSKIFKTKVRIKSGLTSKTKILEEG